MWCRMMQRPRSPPAGGSDKAADYLHLYGCAFRCTYSIYLSRRWGTGGATTTWWGLLMTPTYDGTYTMSHSYIRPWRKLIECCSFSRRQVSSSAGIKPSVWYGLKGSKLHTWRKIIEKTKDGHVLKLSPEYILPLRRDHIYLGACITYGDFEHKNMQHRIHAGKVAFQRVRKFLMAAKAANVQKRLRLWKAIVVPTVMYSITASGVLPKGFDLLRVMLTKQARAIARSPRHRLGGESGEEAITESDADFWRKVGIDSPEKLVQSRLKAAVDRTTELLSTLSLQDVRVCSIVRGREQATQQQFQDRCIQPDGAAAVHTCDICGAKFGDHSSLRAHKARLHSTERRRTAAPTFDRQHHGVDGMPTCSMCGHKFPRWARRAPRVPRSAPGLRTSRPRSRCGTRHSRAHSSSTRSGWMPSRKA